MKNLYKITLVVLAGFHFGCGTAPKLPPVISTASQAHTYLRPFLKAVTTLDGASGGTGFYVKAKSGKRVLLTAAHVCDAVVFSYNEIKTVMIRRGISPADLPEFRAVLARDPIYDLCVVDVPDNGDGDMLELAKTPPDRGEEVFSSGFGRLLDAWPLRGIVGPNMLFPVTVEFAEQCTKPFSIFLPECRVMIELTAFTLPVVGGHSGSPIIDGAGNVVSIVLQSSDRPYTSYGAAIPAIKRILEAL